MHKRINEADGKAQEIIAIAQATAESITKVGASLIQEGGDDAIKLRLAQAYLTQFGELGQDSTQVLLPADLTKIDELLASVGLNFGEGLPKVESYERVLAQASSSQKVPVMTQEIKDSVPVKE